MMAWELSEKYDTEFEVWRERERQKQQVNEARFREVVHGPSDGSIFLVALGFALGVAALVCLVNEFIPVGR